MSDLSPEHYEQVLKYMETANEDNFETATLVLQQHDFNLEVSDDWFREPSKTSLARRHLDKGQPVPRVPAMKRSLGNTSNSWPGGTLSRVSLEASLEASKLLSWPSWESSAVYVVNLLIQYLKTWEFDILVQIFNVSTLAGSRISSQADPSLPSSNKPEMSTQDQFFCWSHLLIYTPMSSPSSPRQSYKNP